MQTKQENQLEINNSIGTAGYARTVGEDGKSYRTGISALVSGAIGDDIEDLENDISSLQTAVGTNTTAIGTLANLSTTEKSNLVGAINEVNEDVSDVKEELTKQVIFSSWEKGSFSADGSISASSNATVSSLEEITGFETIVIRANARCVIAYYDSSKTYIGKVAADGSINKTAGTWKFFTTNIQPSIYAPLNAKYFRIGCSPTDSTTITVATVTSWSNEHFALNVEAVPILWSDVSKIQTQLALNSLTAYIRSKFVSHYSHNGSGSYEPNTTRNAIIKPLMFEFDISVNIASGFKYAIQYFDGYETGASHYIGASQGWQYGNNIITAGSYFGIIVAYSNDQTADDSTTNSLTFATQVTADDVYYRLLPLYDIYHAEKTTPKDYVLGADLHKTELIVEELGTLSYAQAFCKYDNKYYSVDDRGIAVQDSSFASVGSASLNLGHGNSLQLGSNGFAYVSGWDDNNIYKVDLVNLVIDSTIALPTTGYTSGVVDEVKNLAYIFQRDSLPDHEANYNFIVYDITNNEIISTKTILAFGAMQACDLFNDRIVVLNGLGNSTCPNGYRIFDTNGNIIADYYFGSFATQEPEGVCIDRDTHDLYISMLSKKVYKISPV